MTHDLGAMRRNDRDVVSLITTQTGDDLVIAYALR